MSDSLGHMPPEPDPKGSSAGAPKSSADRMRRYRERQRRGGRIVRVELRPTDIESLIAKGYLMPRERGDAAAIEFATGALVADVLDGLFAP